MRPYSLRYTINSGKADEREVCCVFWVESNQLTQNQLDTADKYPGLMAMMPTHAATVDNPTWNIFKDPRAKNGNFYSLVVAMREHLDDDTIEHADYNTGFADANYPKYVCLEYVGYEASSENWYPDHREMNASNAFSDDELACIMSYIQTVKL
jgi:hypothetical protein